MMYNISVCDDASLHVTQVLVHGCVNCVENGN